MLAILFLLSALAFGLRTTYWIPMVLRIEERVAMAVPLGLAVTVLAGFTLSLVTELSAWTVAAVGTGAAAVGVIGLLSGDRPTRLKQEARDLRKRWRGPRAWTSAAVFSGFAALLVLIFSHAVFQDHGTIYAGFGNVWGDWNQHLSQTTSFLHGDNLPPTLNTMSGQKLTYPFGTNFLSAMLAAAGLPLLTAMKVPVAMLAVSGLALLMVFTRRVAGSGAALLVPALFYLLGGLGFVNAVQDLSRSGWDVEAFFGAQPHNYTQTYTEGIVQNINFINPIYAYVVPQRAFIFGLPLVLTILTILQQALATRQRSLFLAAGLVAAVLPVIHTHGLIFLGLSFPVLVLATKGLMKPKRRRKQRFSDFVPWLYFLAPIALLALPQFIWLTSGVDTTKFLRPQYGWTNHDDLIIWFWMKNLGAFIPLLLLSFVAFRKSPRPPWYPFAISAASIFLIANVFVFQPWDWDNTKLFVYWVVASLPAVAAALVWIWQRGWFGRTVAGLLFVSLLLAGSLDVAKTFAHQHARVGLFDPTAQEIAEAVKRETAPRAVFLTAQQPNNAIAGLAGRRIVMGYTGWLWSYGLRYQDREEDVARMYEGRPETASLLEEYGVDYVVIGPAERGDKGYKLNETYFSTRYPVWHQFDQVTIYKIDPETTPTVPPAAE